MVMKRLLLFIVVLLWWVKRQDMILNLLKAFSKIQSRPISFCFMSEIGRRLVFLFEI